MVPITKRTHKMFVASSLNESSSAVSFRGSSLPWQWWLPPLSQTVEHWWVHLWNNSFTFLAVISPCSCSFRSLLLIKFWKNSSEGSLDSYCIICGVIVSRNFLAESLEKSFCFFLISFFWKGVDDVATWSVVSVSTRAIESSKFGFEILS